ncbi:hypothetical protein SPHINGOAX6_70940 [Sphingomonas sp. AX6]|nr:hypothetical protein SPHINGOAX6_70940 [Sphingomonas sp. AX6]
MKFEATVFFVRSMGLVETSRLCGVEKHEISFIEKRVWR